MIGSPLLIAERARARLRSVVDSMQNGRAPETGGQVDVTSLPPESDVVTTAAEINEFHGTGTLLFRIFPDASSIISLRTSNFYDGNQTFGAASYCLPLSRASRAEVYSWVRWYLSGTHVRRILTIPYLPADPLVSLAVKDQSNAPLCTYIMDDKNVCDDGISDELMEELLTKSDLRLVIGPEMREAYEKKYRMKFWVMPPLVPESLLSREMLPLRDGIDLKRGVLLGNIWGQRWLDMLRETFRDSGYQVDWYCNTKDPLFLTFDRADMERDGIRLQSPIPEHRLPEVLQRYPFAVVPTDTLDGRSVPAVQAIAELSLPSRIPTIVATSHIPVLVIGHPATSASRFVSRFEIGETVPYDHHAVSAALDRLTRPATQAAIRNRAAILSRSLSAKGSAEWIWQSLAAGKPCDLIYENLMPAGAPVGPR
jgi:hypothetical protein